MLGSFKFRFIATALRRLSAVRLEADADMEDRRFRSNAFIVAAAARETEEERGDGEGVRCRWEGWGVEGEAGLVVEVDMRDWSGELEAGERD
jgi:hypothetical protein